MFYGLDGEPLKRGKNQCSLEHLTQPHCWGYNLRRNSWAEKIQMGRFPACHKFSAVDPVTTVPWGGLIADLLKETFLILELRGKYLT